MLDLGYVTVYSEAEEDEQHSPRFTTYNRTHRLRPATT